MIKATGIVRRIDDLGRVVIPKSLRRTLNLNEFDPLEIFIDGERIILQKYAHGCVICGAIGEMRQVKGKLVCQGCIGELIHKS